MSKSSHFTGQPVYSQVLKLLDKAEIDDSAVSVPSVAV